MPIKNRLINVEVLPVMRFAPDDATLIADSTGDSAIAPGIGPKPQADELASERPRVAHLPAPGRSSTSFQSSPSAPGQPIAFFVLNQ